MGKNTIYLFYTGGTLLFLIATLFFLGGLGERARVVGYAGAPDDPRIADKFIIDRPEDAYRIWKKRGYRGRVAVSFAQRLYFVEQGESAFIPRTMIFPVRPFNLSKPYEESLYTKNFLFVAMMTGVAREVIQVLPEQAFADRLKEVHAGEGITVSETRISSPLLGSPRYVTTIPFLPAMDEPVLLFISASFFRSYTPEALLRELHKAGLKTDCVVLSGNPLFDADVTEEERERLHVFARLIGAENGRN